MKWSKSLAFSISLSMCSSSARVSVMMFCNSSFRNRSPRAWRSWLASTLLPNIFCSSLGRESTKNLETAGIFLFRSSPRRFSELVLPASSLSKSTRNFLPEIFCPSMRGSKSSLYPPTDKVAMTAILPAEACQMLMASISPSTTTIKSALVKSAVELKSLVLVPACIFQYCLLVLSRSLRGRAAR